MLKSWTIIHGGACAYVLYILRDKEVDFTIFEVSNRYT